MANAITGVRILCALALIFCPTFSAWFYVLYLIGGVSDVLDGVVARRFNKETKFGARFDTVADAAFFAVAIIKTVRAVVVPTWLILWVVCIAVLKCFSVIVGFVKYKRFVPEHTVMNKICGVLLFAAPLFIGWVSQKTVTITAVVLCLVATVAAAWEGVDIYAGKEIR